MSPTTSVSPTPGGGDVTATPAPSPLIPIPTITQPPEAPAEATPACTVPNCGPIVAGIPWGLITDVLGLSKEQRDALPRTPCPAGYPSGKQTMTFHLNDGSIINVTGDTKTGTQGTIDPDAYDTPVKLFITKEQCKPGNMPIKKVTYNWLLYSTDDGKCIEFAPKSTSFRFGFSLHATQPPSSTNTPWLSVTAGTNTNFEGVAYDGVCHINVDVESYY
ncbi:MAG: hypothetical protein OYH77_00505 [Pseudomonadota bacterium]|nr:hypothetical protein [Pseudomonadota bacterium]